jgi:hypothetical protein
MVVLAYCIEAMLRVVVPGGRPEDLEPGIFGHLFSILIVIAATFVLGVLIFAIGRVFGGTATREQSIVAASWHLLVMTLVLPVLLIGAGETGLALAQMEDPAAVSPGTLLVLALYTSLYVWLLAKYAAAIHGFRSEWPAVGVIVGLALLISSLFVLGRGG